MLKLGIPRVAWSAQASGYQVHEKAEQGTSLTQMDFESAAWQEWLGRMPSFAFQSKDGHRFTAPVLCFPE